MFTQTQGRESIAAKLVANLITEAGANRVLACDLHSGQSVGYFDIPVDQVYGQVLILSLVKVLMIPWKINCNLVCFDVKIDNRLFLLFLLILFLYNAFFVLCM